MPEVSRFFGIVIAIYYKEHAPPHFHARYGEHDAQVEIGTGRLMAGSMPPRAQHLVVEWSQLHHTELIENWKLAEQRQPLRRISPLE